MDDKDTPKPGAFFEASLPLPAGQDNPSNTKINKDDQANPAADLIRKRVAQAYTAEPDAQTEREDINAAGSTKLSRHQQFITELTSSGKSLQEIQVAWHEYYAGLPDQQKHQVWQEFYDTHARAAHSSAQVPSMVPASVASSRKTRSVAKATTPAPPRDLRKNPTIAEQAKTHLNSAIFGLGVGLVVLLIFMFSFFNERFIAPFIQPSRNVSSTPIISGSAVGSAPEVIIPKINVEIPVVYGVNTVDENQVENALENGVVHYADTAMPGQNGNLVIVGHSSNNIFNKGKYKFAFVLLSRLDTGDTFYIQKDGQRYTYQIYKKIIVSPTDVSVLGSTDKTATATLITCDPPGTSANRLVVIGEQVSPDPQANVAANTQNTLATSAKIVPGNSPSLWSRLIHIF